MVVVVRIKIKTANDKEVTVPAIANAGFESDRPEIIIPREVARNLGLSPKKIVSRSNYRRVYGCGWEKV